MKERGGWVPVVTSLCRSRAQGQRWLLPVVHDGRVTVTVVRVRWKEDGRKKKIRGFEVGV